MPIFQEKNKGSSSSLQFKKVVELEKQPFLFSVISNKGGVGGGGRDALKSDLLTARLESLQSKKELA